ncbi:MAG: permease [Chloroflexota bacterium]
MGPAHFGVAFAAKPLAPKVPLWALLIASQALDLLCFGFIAAGIEHTGTSQTDLAHGIQILAAPSLAWSHGLTMSAVWSVLAAGIALIALRDRRASAIVGLVVFSHWLLDFIVHGRYLPVFFDPSLVVGLGLWGSGPGLIASGILEAGLLATGIATYWMWRKRIG